MCKSCLGAGLLFRVVDFAVAARVPTSLGLGGPVFPRVCSGRPKGPMSAPLFVFHNSPLPFPFPFAMTSDAKNRSRSRWSNVDSPTKLAPIGEDEADTAVDDAPLGDIAIFGGPGSGGGDAPAFVLGEHYQCHPKACGHGHGSGQDRH